MPLEFLRFTLLPKDGWRRGCDLSTMKDVETPKNAENNVEMPKDAENNVETPKDAEKNVDE